MYLLSRVFTLLFLLSLLLSSVVSAKTYSVSYDPDYAPFSFSQDDKAYGLFIDIWRLWAKENHHKVIFQKAKNWDDALRMAKDAEVDFFLGTSPYEKWMLSSKTYYKTSSALFVRKTLNKSSIKKIGIVGEDYKEELNKKFLNADVLSFTDYKELFNALVSKKVDAIYDDSLAISYFSIENKYTHLLKKTSLLPTTSDIKAISSLASNIEVFDAGFKNIDTLKLVKIESDWIYAKDERYFENKKQTNDIEIHYVYDPDWKPFEFQDKMNKMHIGIIADILSLVSSKTGIKFLPVSTKNWAESVAMIKESRADMFSAVPVTKEREKYLNFTKNSIYSYPAVLMSKSSSEYTLEKSLKGKSIGVIKENSLGTWVREQYPYAFFKEFTSIEDALDALTSGDIDFFAINGVSALYYINVQGYKEFKIYSIMDYMFHLKVALRKDVPKYVIDLIDKGLSQITKKELSDIYHNWTSIKVKKELNLELLAYIVLFIFFLIITFLVINKKLKKIVKMKTFELQELNESLEEKVRERTHELAIINKNMKANIEYASLIQNAILPLQRDINSFFKDSFVLWRPKDIVGGDIYFFEQLSDDEVVLFVIDCTGHGVSGAFVTMLTKAIEEQLLVEAQQSQISSPSYILSYFNRTFKNLLHEESNSSVGFDAGVVYINKKENVLKYGGAKMPLFYTLNDEVKQLEADKHSVGYNHCKVEHIYQEHTLEIEDGMKFYLTSDGYLDQNGGERGFPLGKKHLKSFIQNNRVYEFAKQKSMFVEQLEEYQGSEERNDDIVFIGFEI